MVHRPSVPGGGFWAGPVVFWACKRYSLSVGGQSADLVGGGCAGLTRESWRWAVEMADFSLHFVFRRGRCGCVCICLAFGVQFPLWLEWATITGSARFVLFALGRHARTDNVEPGCRL